MAGSSYSKKGLPENLVSDLHRRLRWHGFWDCLLIISPPFLAIYYLVFKFLIAGWITMEVTVFTLAASLGLLLGLVVSFGWVHLSMASIARLIDDRLKAKDRFLTLTTIDPTVYPSSLILHLRREATRFLDRINLKRDFPYRFGSFFFASLVGSLVVVLLFYIFLQISFYNSSQAASIKELSVLARQLSKVPPSAELGNSLNELAARIREQGLLNAGNEDRVQNLLKQIRQQMATGGGSGEGRSDLLGQASGTLQGLAESMKKGRRLRGDLDAQQAGNRMNERKKLTVRGGGGSNGDPTLGGRTKERGESQVQVTTERNGRKQGDRDGHGKDQPRSADGTGSEKEALSKAEKEGERSKDGQGKIPGGKLPQRYYKADERGEKGIEGARYVIVELPEAEGASEVSVTSKSRRELHGPKVPVSNLPLPSRSRRDAPLEKQRIPLEYRGMLR